MDFLKDVLGDELYSKVAEKLKGNDKIKLANLADGGYVGKEKFDAAQATVADLQKQLADRDKDIAGLKKSAGDNETLTKQLSDLQGKYKTDTESLSAKLKQSALNAALDLGITKAKGKNATAIKALLDMSKLALKDDGTVDGLDVAIEGLKKSDGYMFDQTTTTQVGTGHAGSGADSTPENQAIAAEFTKALGI